MAKRSTTSKIEIIEVQTPKVDNRVPLHEVMDQLAKKAGSGTRAAARGGAGTSDPLARIKELSAQLAQELRALQGSTAAGGPAPAKSRKRSK